MVASYLQMGQVVNIFLGRGVAGSGEKPHRIWVAAGMLYNAASHCNN